MQSPKIVPSLGLCSLVLGGEISFASRKIGLTCNSAVELEIVTAAGEILNIKPNNKYDDLFRACYKVRNGNFGVMIAINF